MRWSGEQRGGRRRTGARFRRRRRILLVAAIVATASAMNRPASAAPPVARATGLSGQPSTAHHEAAPIGPRPMPASPPSTANDAGVAVPRPAAAGAPAGDGSARSEILRVAGALAAVIGVIVLIRIGFKRFGPAWMSQGSRPSGVVEILARYPVARGQALILIKMLRRVLLVHQSGSAMTTLTEVSDHEEVALLLGRIEAATGRRSEDFEAALADSAAPYRALAAGPQRRRLPAAARADVVDLTRRRTPSSLQRFKSGRLRQ